MTVEPEPGPGCPCLPSGELLEAASARHKICNLGEMTWVCLLIGGCGGQLSIGIAAHQMQQLIHLHWFHAAPQGASIAGRPLYDESA